MNKLYLALITFGIFALSSFFLLDSRPMIALINLSVSFGILIGIGILATNWTSIFKFKIGTVEVKGR